MQDGALLTVGDSVKIEERRNTRYGPTPVYWHGTVRTISSGWVVVLGVLAKERACMKIGEVEKVNGAWLVRDPVLELLDKKTEG